MDCSKCKMNSRTLDGGTDDNTFCSRLDMINDIPFLTPCPDECCQGPQLPEGLPFWLYIVLIVLLVLIILSTIALVA